MHLNLSGVSSKEVTGILLLQAYFRNSDVLNGFRTVILLFSVGELMGVEPVPACVWRQAQMLPWLLHRVTGLCSALSWVEPAWAEQRLSLTGLHQARSEITRRSAAEMEDRMRFLIRPQRFTDTMASPSPGQMVQALTLASAADNWDMERLEILGDSFLKIAVTIFLYYKMENTCDEGDFSLARSRIVGNRNLMVIAKNLGLPESGIVSRVMDPARTWTPPGYSSETLDEFDAVEDKLVSLDANMTTWQVGQLSKFVTTEDISKLKSGELSEAGLIDLAKRRKAEHEQVRGVSIRGYNILPDKSLADCVEAMMGCYLYNCGMDHCLEFMARVGINLDSEAELSSLYKRVRDLNNNNKTFEHFKPQTDAFVNRAMKTDTLRYQRLLNKLGVEEIEEILDYSFQEKSFLLEAFTHPSYEDNRLTHSYEKLEFLGDAVLDYLVTCYIFTHTRADPGKLTDIRSALVCNNEFASILTDFSLDKFILHCNPGILNRVTAYLDLKNSEEFSVSETRIDSTVRKYNEDDVPEHEMIEVPKVLGDVLEAVMGAIYIDSGHDLEMVWRVYRRLCPDFEDIVKNPPKNMKKELLEKYPGPGMVRFSKAKTEGDVVFVEAEVTTEDGGQPRRFRGRGKNKTLATLAACKCALREMKAKK